MSSKPRPAETLWLRPGQVIIREGEVSRELYVLLSGELKAEVGGKKIASIVEHGEVVGEMGALSGMPRTATVSARTTCEVLQIHD
ncbi:MAG: cyclic nucleotide-binding domain-containing protein, partial [Candidatus Hydrogenedentota bacterium]